LDFVRGGFFYGWLCGCRFETRAAASVASLDAALCAHRVEGVEVQPRLLGCGCDPFTQTVTPDGLALAVEPCLSRVVEVPTSLRVALKVRGCLLLQLLLVLLLLVSRRHRLCLLLFLGGGAGAGGAGGGRFIIISGGSSSK